MVLAVRASAGAMSKAVVHDGRQCGCPSKVVCEDAEEAQCKRPRPKPPEPVARMYDQFDLDWTVSAAVAGERLRIRRAQRDALRELQDAVTSLAAGTVGSYQRVLDGFSILDAATRTPRKAKGKK